MLVEKQPGNQPHKFDSALILRWPLRASFQAINGVQTELSSSRKKKATLPGHAKSLRHTVHLNAINRSPAYEVHADMNEIRLT